MPRKKRNDTLKWVEDEFFRQANDDGILGDPAGELAYGYLRVSSRGQGEEGRSGLPRQMEHIGEKARHEGFYLVWDTVFFDDSTGFTFEERHNLLKLLDEVRLTPKANKLLMEYPDRLSRDHTWRYGYLREQFSIAGIQFIYWEGYKSEVERSVIGVVSEQGMRNELSRMHDGTLRKARSGRVTAKTPAYGYKFVDDKGRPRTDPASTWRKNTHYAIKAEESKVMVRIYEALAYQGATLLRLADQLNEEGISPPKSSSEWEASLISKLIKNTVYKGEFTANRWYYKKVRSKRTGKMVKNKFQRPEEEWIKAPVPPTVSEQTWTLANKAVKKNKTKSKRNLHYDALLVSYVKCATCNHSYIFGAREVHRNGHTWLVSWYECGSSFRTKQARERIGCDQSRISAKRLDAVVWKVISNILLQPNLLIEAMEQYYFDQGMETVHKQINYIHQQLEECNLEDDKLYKAYLAEVFDEQEYAARRRILKQKKVRLEDEERKFNAMLITQEQFEAKKRQILTLSEQIRSGSQKLDLPFNEKRRLMKMLVDEVRLDVNNGQFTLMGAIKGAFALQGDNFVSLPADRGSSKPPA